jgi:hypothetical protein
LVRLDAARRSPIEEGSEGIGDCGESTVGKRERERERKAGGGRSGESGGEEGRDSQSSSESVAVLKKRKVSLS